MSIEAITDDNADILIVIERNGETLEIPLAQYIDELPESGN